MRKCAIARAPARHRDLYATDVLRTFGTANLLRAARELGARRFVTQSFLYVYGFVDHGDAPVTEDTPLGPGGGGEFDRHVAAMRSTEQQVFDAAGIEGVALRYGFFYGPEPATLSEARNAGNDNDGPAAAIDVASGCKA